MDNSTFNEVMRMGRHIKSMQEILDMYKNLPETDRRVVVLREKISALESALDDVLNSVS